MCDSVINLDKKYIFSHIEKTAGTSVSVNLRQYDQMYCIVNNLRQLKNGDRIILKPVSGEDYPNMHIRLATIRKLMPENEDWDSYYKFTFVRNPIHRYVSLYLQQLKYFLGINNIDPYKTVTIATRGGVTLNISKEMQLGIETGEHSFTFDFFVRRYMPCTGMTQLRQISDNDGNLLTNFIGKFEQLVDDWHKVCYKIQIPFTTLSKLRVTGTNGVVDICDSYYTKDLKDFVYEKDNREFKEFGYEKRS